MVTTTVFLSLLEKEDPIDRLEKIHINLRGGIEIQTRGEFWPPTPYLAPRSLPDAADAAARGGRRPTAGITAAG